MKIDIISDSLVTVDRCITLNFAEDSDYVDAEFMCSILNIIYYKDIFIFNVIKNEYINQSKLIDKIIIFSDKNNSLEIRKFISINKSILSPFIFAYVDRNI